MKFTKNKVRVKSRFKGEETVLDATRGQNGLYSIDIKEENKIESLLTTNKEIIHRKLGHLSFANIEKLTNLNEGMDPLFKLKTTIKIFAKYALN